MGFQAKYYVFKNNMILVRKNDPRFLPLQEAVWQRLQPCTEEIIPLKIKESGPAYVAEVTETYDPGEEFEWLKLRSLIGRLEDEQFNIWSGASQLLNWRSSHRYCGRCGVRTHQHPIDLARICPSCSATYYPRISPCIIVLISRGEEILLARAAKFKNNMYSTLAGFIEPGESAEAALHREIAEEVGIRVNNISYFGSQSWPFPGQLMLGFFADYASGQIEIDDDEIIDAQWFHISSLPLIPGQGSIAGRLIRSYAHTDHRK